MRPKGGRPRIEAVVGAIELLSDERAKPGQDCVWFGGRGHRFEASPSESFADSRLEWTVPDRSIEDGTADVLENPILREQVFILQQRLLIRQPGHVR